MFFERTDADGDLLAFVVAGEDGRVAGQNGRFGRSKNKSEGDKASAVFKEPKTLQFDIDVSAMRHE